jgi:hypothetical protein
MKEKSGIVEQWKNGMMGGMKKSKDMKRSFIIIPIFHHSNIPVIEQLWTCLR